MLKTMFLTASVALLPVEAFAISRYNTQSMSCGEVQAAVRSEGAAILRWKSPTSGVQRYARFVRGGGYCAASEQAERSSVPTADRKSCPVYECKQYNPDDDDGFFWLRR